MSRISQRNLQFSAIPVQTLSEFCWPEARHTPRVQTFTEMESVRKSVDEVAFAEPNWDGYGALPISGETKRNAISAIRVLARSTPKPAVVPNANGTLTFEWETDAGVGNLEIGKTRYSFYVKPTAGRAIFSDGEADKVAGFLGAIVEGVLYPKPAQPAFSNLQFLAADV